MRANIWYITDFNDAQDTYISVEISKKLTVTFLQKIVENWNLDSADRFITLVSEKFQYLFALDKILIQRLSNITSDKYLSGLIRSTISNSHVLTSYMT